MPRLQKQAIAPSDPQTFNKIFEVNREEIARIFRHIIQKYPCADGHDSAFNDLFVSLYELKVFQRWSVARVVHAEVKRRTGSEQKATKVYNRLVAAGNDEAERVATEMGINLKAKRGQFIYKWIEHILGQQYLQDGNHSRRFHNFNVDSCSTDSWADTRRNVGFIPWSARAADDSPEDRYAGSGAWGLAVNHDRRHFPHYGDQPTCVGEYSYSEGRCAVEDYASQSEAEESLFAGVSEVDRFILMERAQGYSVREIRERMAANQKLPNLSHQSINNRLKKLRAKPTTSARR